MPLLQKARVEAQQQLEWTQWQVQQLSEELAVAQVSGVGMQQGAKGLESGSGTKLHVCLGCTRYSSQSSLLLLCWVLVCVPPPCRALPPTAQQA